MAQMINGTGLGNDPPPRAQSDLRRRQVVPDAPAAGPRAAADVPENDWDDLFTAVTDRLTLLAGNGLAAAAPGLPHALAHAVQTGVLECVAAMEQLHAIVTRERLRNHRLELELFDARTTLAQARIELVGSRSDERRSRRLALHDELTSLPNRSFFGQWLDDALAHDEPEPEQFAVFYLDLDGFKRVNDDHGHEVGDELLRVIGARLARAIRAEDVVSRLGGDEFACLLTNLSNREQLSHLASKLFDTVSAPVKIGPHEVTVRPSIGIAMCPADGATAEELLSRADAAMYSAKRQQSGYAFFDEQPNG